jgi:hypothetical protein
MPIDYSLPVYWPASYYAPSMRLALEYDLIHPVASFSNNTGNKTLYISSYTYLNYGTKVPGKDNERSLNLYIRASDNPAKVDVFDGPTITLVQTAAFSTRFVSGPTGTAKPKPDVDDEDGKFKGVIAGIVLGVLVGIVLLTTGCAWCYGCCCFKKRRSGSERDKQRGIVEQGVELMGQRSGGGRAQDGLVGGRAERESSYKDPPPKYVP